ncbi:MAG: sugar ABC transporter permease [Sphaerochaeta sp.]|nr:sugar ABC transporter permease [Sphaerochaeta sp.]
MPAKAMRTSFIKKEGVQGWLMILPNTLGLLLFYLIPIGWSIILSLFKWNGLSKMKFIGFQNFGLLFSDASFLYSLRNTFIYSIAVVPLIILFVLCFGVLLARDEIKGVAGFRTLYFLPVMTMPVAAALIWKWLLNSRFGLVNKFLGYLSIPPINWLTSPAYVLPSVIIIGIWLGVAYDLIIIISGMKGIPGMYYEAADIDGASGFRKFFSITLPLLTPSLFFILITQLISCFQVFDTVSIILGADPPGSLWNAACSVVMNIYQNGFVNFRMGYSSAQSFMLFCIVLLITLVQFKVQKKWVNYA